MWTRQRVRLQCRVARQCLQVQASQCAAICPRRYKSTSVPSGQEDEVESLELQRMGQSPQLRSLLAGPAKRADVVVKRPVRFSKPGLARDLLKYLKDFPHALLLCRVGQFYESYFDQAIEIADLLKIRLTSKSMEGTRYPMCGFPIAQLDKFLEKLVRENNRFVAMCEEEKHYDDNGTLNKITRKVVRVVTPGTLVDETFIEKSQHNYLLAVDIPHLNSDAVELAWMDTSTGELLTQGSSLSKRAFQEDVGRIAPTEVVLPFALSSQEQESHPILQALRRLDNPPVISFPHGTPSHSPPSIEADANAAFNAIPLLSSYISETLLEQRPDFAHPLRVSPANNMLVDRVTLRALEVKQNNDGGVSGTLLSVMDRCVTSAGKRLLADRLTAPSKSVSEINARLSLVDYFKNRRRLSDDLVLYLKQLDDEARLLQKMSIGRPTAEDLLMVAKAIRIQGQIKALLENEVKGDIQSSTDDDALAGIKRLVGELRNFDDIAERIETSVDSKALEAQRTRDFAAELAASQASTEDIEAAEEEGIDIWNIPLDVILGKRRKTHSVKAEEMVADPPVAKNGTAPISWGKGETSVLQPGSSKIIGQLYKSIANVETRAKRTYNELAKLVQAPPGELLFKVMPRFGPVVRVGWKKTHPPAMRLALQALDDKGTLTLVRKSAIARYFTLNTWTKHNSEMQGLFVRLKEAESVAIRDLCNEILTSWHELRTNARITAELDVACGLAKVAEEGGYIRPTIVADESIHIEAGRHPVAEHELKKDGRIFTPNDTCLDKASLLHIVTGPNMGGKSTVLRQVGLICIMAQAGSFVPASSARVGIVDQLFARIRYSDNIARGRSSFQVEMDDASYILQNATSKSFVLLDEFGRGTTADYAACIAESTIFALANEIGTRSLFATHLHDIHDIIHDDPELSTLQTINFYCTRLSANPSDKQKEVHYLYKLVPGINRDAEAFTVAQVAGYPAHLLQRARSIYEKRKKQ